MKLILLDNVHIVNYFNQRLNYQLNGKLTLIIIYLESHSAHRALAGYQPILGFIPIARTCLFIINKTLDKTLVNTC